MGRHPDSGGVDGEEHVRELRRPPLLVAGAVLRWTAAGDSTVCIACGQRLRGEGYVGQRQGRGAEPGDGEEGFALCEPCALTRAQGSSGTARVDGEERRCRVASWDPALPDVLEVILDDGHSAVRRDRERMVRRTVALTDFQPERDAKT